mgnify:FL=1
MRTSNKALLSILFILSLSCRQREISLDQFINTEIENGKAPGIGLSIIIKGDILVSKGYGYADIENRIPFTDSTIMNIASISKTFIGVSVMHAVEKGLLNLEDDVNKFLSFKIVNPHRPDKVIKVKHLLGHRSSIIDEDKTYKSSYFYGGDAPTGLGNFLEKYLSKNGAYYSEHNFLDKDPGTIESYSNIGAGLAAHILENIMKKPFNLITKDLIFRPLGMKNTVWFLSEMENQSSHAKLYKNEKDKNKLIDVDLYGLITYPDGGLRTSVKDLTKYLHFIMCDMPVQDIINKESKENMLTPDFDQTYAKFWDTKDLIGHGGWDPGVTSSMYFDPKNEIGIILFTNTSTYANFYALQKKTYKHALTLRDSN